MKSKKVKLRELKTQFRELSIIQDIKSLVEPLSDYIISLQSGIRSTIDELADHFYSSSLPEEKPSLPSIKMF